MLVLIAACVVPFAIAVPTLLPTTVRRNNCRGVLVLVAPNVRSITFASIDVALHLDCHGGGHAATNADVGTSREPQRNHMKTISMHGLRPLLCCPLHHCRHQRSLAW